MIEIAELAKRYGRRPVLQGVDLRITRGRITAIVGPNGAGKTTLIKTILGLSRADAGRIMLDGVQLDGGVDYRARIGYMPQIARFPENLTAAELLALLKDLRASTDRDRRALDEELIDRFALGPQLDKPLRTLSGGTRQKVNAVTAFLFRPELLVLDEPTSGLDPVASSVLKDKIHAERRAGLTVVLTSHLMGEVDELADDLAFLLDGRVRFAGALEALKATTRQATLERAIAKLMAREAA
ncbi:MAG: ABC transporter ATP-binding protein [Gemmatimonadaceae bacterium]|nr:ABC transporter ATP-binding protein [Gemmatimonadaceae bacterium]NUQ91304.1 ABC transporter ATP-binding protein [Gemmatimonadaceae bacterium]NUR20463.1 ABC transporter ATP-binding protein [Gemmatimonadaceae bacterium]